MFLRHRTSRHERGRRRGASVAEMALVLPVVLLLLFGTIDFTQVVYAYTTVSEAARVGARYAMTHGSLSTSPVGPTANDSTVQSEVVNNAYALQSSNLTVTSSWGQGSNQAGCPVTVSATYACPLTIGKFIGINTVDVTGSTTMLITH